jgi:hypothetical protein
MFCADVLALVVNKAVPVNGKQNRLWAILDSFGAQGIDEVKALAYHQDHDKTDFDHGNIRWGLRIY